MYSDTRGKQKAPGKANRCDRGFFHWLVSYRTAMLSLGGRTICGLRISRRTFPFEKGEDNQQPLCIQAK